MKITKISPKWDFVFSVFIIQLYNELFQPICIVQNVLSDICTLKRRLSSNLNILFKINSFTIIYVLLQCLMSTTCRSKGVNQGAQHVTLQWRHNGRLIAFQIYSLTIFYSTVYSDADQRKHQSSASLAFVRGIHRGPVNFPHKWPVTRKMFPFDDVIM